MFDIGGSGKLPRMTVPIDVRILANLSPPDWWTIGLTGLATILGAVIGAGIAYAVARQTAKDNTNAAAAARRETEEAATLRAEVKLMELMNAVGGYHLAIERSIEGNLKEYGEGVADTWQVMLSFAGKPREVRFRWAEAERLLSGPHS